MTFHRVRWLLSVWVGEKCDTDLYSFTLFWFWWGSNSAILTQTSRIRSAVPKQWRSRAQRICNKQLQVLDRVNGKDAGGWGVGGRLLHFIKIIQWERWISERVHVHERKSSANILLKLDGSSVLCYFVCPSGQAERQRRILFSLKEVVLLWTLLAGEGHFSMTVLWDEQWSCTLWVGHTHVSALGLTNFPLLFPSSCLVWDTQGTTHPPLLQVPLSDRLSGCQRRSRLLLAQIVKWSPSQLHRRYLKIQTLAAVCSLMLWCHFGGKMNPILISSH